jgi:hypothetical protein
VTQVQDTDYEGWGILELMGHRKLAGKLSTQKVAGASFLRIDIPARKDTAIETEFVSTQFVNPTSIYAMHPTTEEVARAVAASIAPDPVTKWDVKALLPASAEGKPADLPAVARQSRFEDSMFVDGTYDEDDDDDEENYE